MALLAVVSAFWTAGPALAQAGTDSARKTFDLGQELALAGRGALKGDVQAPGLEVGFLGRGVLRVVDVSGDTELTCRGEGRKRVSEDGDGHAVTVCAGFGGATVTGSEFRFELLARRARAHFPGGASGTLAAVGRWQTRGDGREGGYQRPNRPKPELGGPSGQSALDEEIDQALGG